MSRFFKIIKFVDDGSFEFISSAWTIDDNNCYWPDTINPNILNRLRASHTDPLTSNITFKPHKIVLKSIKGKIL